MNEVTGKQHQLNLARQVKEILERKEAFKIWFQKEINYMDVTNVNNWFKGEYLFSPKVVERIEMFVKQYY